MQPIIFAFYVDNAIDLITNSSSELFVFVGDTKRKMHNLIKKIYPAYRSEYDQLKTIEELTHDELHTYVESHYHNWSNAQQRQVEELIPGLTRDDMYVDVKRTWKDYYGQYQTDTYVREITDDNRQLFMDGIDPDRKMFFLFSLDENPNWDKQQALWNLGERYHLG